MKRKGAVLLLVAILLVTVLSACGESHNYGSWIDDVPATCTVAGVKGHYHCDDCGKNFDPEKIELSDEELEIPATGIHNYGDWIVDEAPTCIKTGSQHRVCKDCKVQTETEVIPVADHTPGNWVVDKEPTCAEAGSRHQVCAYCGTTILTEEIPVIAHTPGEWRIETEATSTQPGVKVRVCAVCGQDLEETAEIPVLHTHTLGEWVVVSEATCTEDGYRYRACTGCGVTRVKETTPALGHDLGEWIEEVPQNGDEPGIKGHYHCERCEKNFDADGNEIDNIYITSWSIVV